MVHMLSAFLDFCYYVHQDVIDEDMLVKIDNALECFHHECVIFITVGVCDTISLPC